jgi:hypothetical protein
MLNFIGVEPKTLIQITRLGKLLDSAEFVDIRGRQVLIELVTTTTKKQMEVQEILDYLDDKHPWEESFDIKEFQRIFSNAAIK